jgi:transposase
MGHCYSLDLRVRVADFVEAGHSCRAAARHFDVSDSFAIKLVRRTRYWLPVTLKGFEQIQEMFMAQMTGPKRK